MNPIIDLFILVFSLLIWVSVSFWIYDKKMEAWTISRNEKGKNSDMTDVVAVFIPILLGLLVAIMVGYVLLVLIG